MRLLQFDGDEIVVAEIERLERGKLDVLIGAHVAGGEELAFGDFLGIVGHVERGDLRGREIRCVVVRQHVAGAGFHKAAAEGAQRIGDGLVGAVDLGEIEVGGDFRDLLERVGGAGACRGIGL